ncbi:Dicer-like protein 1 [Coemansia brasiliensis]|uniref:Dicer-like protein 1 n=1 Tax=Coemansia brasiliensis TaxID=2650707 RepID=A0A9W8IC65_9FUNG|nr:Dicer-like protein 1 [Coemansia brasiliensis]
MTEDTGPALKPRSYQLSLFREALKTNSIVMLETGTGKTLVAVMLIEWFAKHANSSTAVNNKRRKVRVFLNNTVALVHQQAQVISRNTNQTVHEYVGAMGMEDWVEATWTKTWAQADVLVMTHQVLLNALRAGRARITDIDLLVFDEAHHARGNHPYALIMREFYDHCTPSDRPHIFAMTASPLNKQQTAQESVQYLQASLDSNMCTVDLTTDSLVSVSAPTAVCYEYALPPEFHNTPLTKALAAACSESRVVARGLKLADVVLPLLGPFGVDQLWHYYIGQWHRSAALRPAPSSKTLPGAQQPPIANNNDCADDTLLDIAYLKRALEINRKYNQTAYVDSSVLEHDFKSMLVDNMQTHPMPQIRALAAYRRPWAEVRSQLSPQVNRLLGILIQWREDPRSLRGIVFTNRRITAILLVYIVSLISEFDFIRADVLLGSAQKSTSYFDRPIRSGSARMVNQLTLADFADGRLNLVFATQVAEEGVDIQPCNLVIRFDIPKTTTSLIQSRGRARMADSQFIVMVPQIESDEVFAVSTAGASVARLADVPDEDHSTIYADSAVASQSTGISRSQHTLPEHMGTYTDYLQLVRLEECLREWCRAESQTANASTPGSGEVIISRNYAHQEYGRMLYNLRTMLRIDSSSGTEIDDIWVEQGDTQGRIYTIVATQARITYMSAIPTIMSYVQHLPQDSFCRLMPIYDFQQVENKPSSLPHLRRMRNISPTSTENGHKQVKASAKPLHAVLFRCTVTLPSNAAVRQVVGPLMPNKRLAKQSAAYRMAKKLHQIGAIDDNLCPIIESDESLEIAKDKAKQTAKELKKRKSKGTRSSVDAYPIATPRVFIPPAVSADNEPTDNAETEDGAYERGSSCTWHVYTWTLKHPGTAKPTRIAFLSVRQMPSDIVLPLYVKQYDPNIEPEKSRPTAFRPQYLGPQVLKQSQVETLAFFSSNLLLRILAIALSWDVAKIGSLLAPLNQQGDGIDFDFAESCFADRSVVYQEGVTDYSHMEGALIMDAFNRGSIKIIEKVCDSVDIYSNLRVYHAKQKGLDMSAAFTAEPAESAEPPLPQSAKRIKSKRQVNTLAEWSEFKRLNSLRPSEQVASGVPLFKVRTLTPSINYLSITVATNTVVDDNSSEALNTQECLEFPEIIYTSPFFCTREPLPIDDIMNLSLLPALLARLNQTLLAYEVKSKLEHPARVNTVRQAITATSSASDVNYERLETLGDSVLKFITSVEMFVKYPDAHEGILSFQRKQIISNSNLCDLSLQLNLPPYIISTIFSRRDVRMPGDGWVRMQQIPAAWMYQASFQQELESSSSTVSNAENSISDLTATTAKSSDVVKETAASKDATSKGTSLTANKKAPASIAAPTSRLLSEKTVADIIESLLGASVYDCGIDAALATARSLGVVDSGWTSWSAFDSVWRANRTSKAYKISQIEAMRLETIANASYSEDTKDLLQEMKLDQSDVLYKLETHKQPLDLAYGMDLSTEQAFNTAQLDKEAVQQIENTLGYTFRNHSLLLEALTHCSSLDLSSSSYQRLEFLGDAILDFLLTKRYYDHQPPLSSHRITLIKHVAASNDLFGVILVQHGLHKYVRHSSPVLQGTIDDYELRLEHACKTWRGNRQNYQNMSDLNEQSSEPQELAVPPAKQRRVSSGSEKLDFDVYADLPPEVWNSVRAPKVLGDLLESLIGAVYVDAGMDFDAAVRVYEHVLSPFLTRFVDTGKLSLHPVIHTLLVCQGWGCDMVSWENTTDPNPLEYKNRYTCRVMSHGQQIATGSGESPRHAKYNAATSFLMMIGASAPSTLDGDLKAIQDANGIKGNSQDKESKLDNLLKPVCTCAERRLEEAKQRAVAEEKKKRQPEKTARDDDTKNTTGSIVDENPVKMDVADAVALDSNNETLEEGEI